MTFGNEQLNQSVTNDEGQETPQEDALASQTEGQESQTQDTDESSSSSGETTEETKPTKTDCGTNIGKTMLKRDLIWEPIVQ